MSLPVRAWALELLQTINAGAPWPINGSACSSESAPQVMLGESGVQRAREIVGRINQSAVEIEKKPASLSGLLPGVGEQSLDELVFE
jgi:hypothetical protein